MAIGSATVLERAGNTILAYTDSNLDGDQSGALVLPAGFGDCEIGEIFFEAFQIATVMASPETNGPLVFINNAANSAQIDFVGPAYWVQKQSGLTAVIKPDTAVLWREGERANYQFAEVDTNASPTADLLVMVRVVRLRNLGG